jgi:hypothetical protein
VIILRQAGTLDFSALNTKYLTPATRPVHAVSSVRRFLQARGVRPGLTAFDIVP